jgi:5-methylcytosine-specific restriction endonuclease McrA
MGRKWTWSSTSVATLRHSVKPPVSNKAEDTQSPSQRVWHSWKWRRLSARIIREVGCCRQCRAPKSDTVRLQVNHIVPMTAMENPEQDPRTWDPKNLEVLCATCHAYVTARDRGIGTNRSIINRIKDELDWLQDEPELDATDRRGGGPGGGGM